VAKELPDTQFAIVDDAAAEGDNIANLLFAEEQGSFLVGAAPPEVRSRQRRLRGRRGRPADPQVRGGLHRRCQEVNPDIEVQSKYLTQPPDFSGFGDPAKGKTAAAGMFDNGADVVYHAAGAPVAVSSRPPRTRGVAIGVDSNRTRRRIRRCRT
jgi:basic membrane protein A